MTARPHPPGDIEVMRNNESHWSGLTLRSKPLTWRLSTDNWNNGCCDQQSSSQERELSHNHSHGLIMMWMCLSSRIRGALHTQGSIFIDHYQLQLRPIPLHACTECVNSTVLYHWARGSPRGSKIQLLKLMQHQFTLRILIHLTVHWPLKYKWLLRNLIQ
jgi:hypothetical protein